MTTAPNSAQNPASPSSRSLLGTAPASTRDNASAPSATSNPPSDGPAYDSDDDLSDAPENPVFPSSADPSNLYPTDPPPESDSDLSDVPDSPVWPGSPKISVTPPRCKDMDCPVRRSNRHHYEGPYLHHGEPPRTNGAIFGDSNPPPHVWESWNTIQTNYRSSTVEDDWNVLGFLRLHVINPNTSFLSNRGARAFWEG